MTSIPRMTARGLLQGRTHHHVGLLPPRRAPPKPSPLVRQHLGIRLVSGSAVSSASSYRLPFFPRLKVFVYTALITLSSYVTYLYTSDTRASFHQYVVPRLVRLLYPDAEAGHTAAVSSLQTLYSLGLHPRERERKEFSNDLAVHVFDQAISNPIGISAGLDKHAEIPDALFALGASIVEVGGCTPMAQPGNPSPRMFRIPGLDGLINRYGLNSHGADAMAARLRTRVRLYARDHGLSEAEVLSGEAGVPCGSLSPGRLLAVQVAKNKDTPERDVEAVARDCACCVRRLAPYADILVVNVSSPNTPGLRDLQAVEPLTRLLSAVVEEAELATPPQRRAGRPKVMVKVSPDEDEESQVEGIVTAVWRSGVDGIIVGNTTKRRTGIVPPGVPVNAHDMRALNEVGGFSGPALFSRTLTLVGRYRKKLDAWGYDENAKQAREEGIRDEAVSVSLSGQDDMITPLPSKKPPQPEVPEQKVIFATGGITTGEQALQVLNAGASVAMVYTGLVYGGAGTITRMKGEMRRGLGVQVTEVM